MLVDICVDICAAVRAECTKHVQRHEHEDVYRHMQKVPQHLEGATCTSCRGRVIGCIRAGSENPMIYNGLFEAFSTSRAPVGSRSLQTTVKDYNSLQQSTIVPGHQVGVISFASVARIFHDERGGRSGS